MADFEMRPGMRHFGLRGFPADRRGGFAMMTAIFLPVALFCAAIAIDLAMLSLDKRKTQAAVDLAAIIAADNLFDYERAARSELSVNGVETVTEAELTHMNETDLERAAAKSQVSVRRGRYVRDLMTAHAERFVAGIEPYNAVRVSVRKTGRYYFAEQFFAAPVYTVAATASAQEVAAFSVGSRLARLDGGIANELLSALTGSQVSLSVLDYNALLDADVDLFGFLDTLAVDMDIVSGRYSDVLSSEPTLDDVLTALANVSEDEGAGAASRALFRLVDAATADVKQVDLARVIDLGPFAELALGGGDENGMPARARVMDILFANAVVANGETLIDLDLSAALPGLASVTAALSIGEAMQDSPWLRVGQDGETVSNVQLRLQIIASLLGEGPLRAIAVRVPIYLELARAEARLGEIRCPGGRVDSAQVDILGRPGVADLWLGEADLSRRVTRDTPVSRARIISAPGLTAYAEARATIDNLQETPLTFTYADIEGGVIKTTATTDILESAFASLARDLDIDVHVLGLGLGGGLLKPALAETLGGTFSLLDGVLESLLATLGVSVGEADIRVNGVRCDRSVLVQ